MIATLNISDLGTPCLKRPRGSGHISCNYPENIFSRGNLSTLETFSNEFSLEVNFWPVSLSAFWIILI